jgi:TPP-dependent pyruvate/acetoin dehydrogenase alpha subunit
MLPHPERSGGWHGCGRGRGSRQARVESIRSDNGPQFLECRTCRFRAHSMFDAQLYRPKEEIESWKRRGPIVRFQGWLQEAGLLHADELFSIEAEVAAEVEAAVAFAETGTLEPVEELERFVLMNEVPA